MSGLHYLPIPVNIVCVFQQILSLCIYDFAAFSISDTHLLYLVHIIFILNLYDMVYCSEAPSEKCLFAHMCMHVVYVCTLFMHAHGVCVVRVVWCVYVCVLCVCVYT